jgi:homoserine dehydrogenase
MTLASRTLEQRAQALLGPGRRGPRARTRPLRVALLGCGGIGSALAQELASHSGFEVCAALVRDTGRPRAIPAERLHTALDGVLGANPDVAVECMGGVETPAQLGAQLLRRGVHLVSANKSMVANALPTLSAAARLGGAHLRFDAAVCAGTPVLEAVATLASAGVQRVDGIVNGTCNFVLHAIEQRGLEAHEALAEAVARGYAEPDPSSDISGQDSAEKLCLLAAAAGLGTPRPQQVETLGLDDVDRPLLNDVRALGCAIRLVAHATRNRLLVAPTAVPLGGVLARTTGTENSVSIATRLAGTVTLQGPGAGAHPTVAALLGDLQACAEGRAGWAERDLPEPPTLEGVASPRERWLLRAASQSDGAPAPSPESLESAIAASGASAGGAAVLRGRALVEVTATRRERLTLVSTLRNAGHRVAALRVTEEATLRF